MGRKRPVSFRFEKNRLLHRGRSVELWDGLLYGQPHIIQRFLKPKSSSTNDYALISRIKHPVLIKPSIAGFTRDGNFCNAAPVDFVPAHKVESQDLPGFCVLLLSLVYALQKRKIRVQWTPEHIVSDARSGKNLLAGLHPLKGSSMDEDDDAKHLTLLNLLASKHLSSNHDLVKVFRKWLRRKDTPVSGCLWELLTRYPHAMEKTLFIYEWPHTRELELVAGLYRLAEQGKGRTVIFQGEAGEGKTTLLRQMNTELLLRDSNTIFFSVPKEERGFQSARLLLRLFQHHFPAVQAMPKEMTEHSMTAYFVKAFEELNAATVVLIDNFQNCDPLSKRFFLRLFQQSTNLKTIFLVTSETAPEEASDFAVILPLQKPSLKQLQEAVFVPFWQEKQRKSYFEKIYERTSGNPLFFIEYLMEALRIRREDMIWNDSEWSFAQSNIPDFPPAILDFYWNSCPDISDAEMRFLEVASVRGEILDLSSSDQPIAESLLQKNILIETKNGVRFRKQLFSEAIQKRLKPERLKRIHRTLADKLSGEVEPESMILLARHHLQAGEASSALEWTLRALEELGNSIEASALPILNELEIHEDCLNESQKLMLYKKQGDLYYRRGNYPHAAAAFKKAIEFTGQDSELRFELGLNLAECHVLQEDILAAQQSLQKIDSIVPRIAEEKSLFRYFITRGICSHYRGPKNSEDFQKAFDFAESLADEALLAHAYRRCAWLSLKEGQLSEASRLARKALRSARMSRDTEEAGHSYKIFASIAWRKSRHDQAEKLMKKSIRAFQKTQNEFGCAGVWNLLGNVHLEKYRFKESVRCFEKAVSLFGHLDHSREVSLAQFNMGLVYLELGRLKEAEKIFLRCRAIDKASGNKWFYAYDIRALAVYCILQGYPKKATRLLNRTIEICEDLKAEGDILQTRMILLFHLLDQGNYRKAHPLVSFLEQKVTEITEPLTEAEIHHLLAYYYGFLNEESKTKNHLLKSLSKGRRIRHYKLLGKNFILSLIFRGKAPKPEDRELSKAIAYFRKSRNQLEFADYLLKLYQAYPVLLKEKVHWKRIRWMESLYRNLHIRPRFAAVRRLMHSRSSESTIEPVYGWWQDLLAKMVAPQDLQLTLMSILKELCGEFHAGYGQIQYLGDAGTFERVLYTDGSITTTVEELPAKILEIAMLRRESFCQDVQSSPDLCKSPWVILHEVKSILALPFFRADQFLGLWYFERRGTAPVFTSKDLQKAAFFSIACTPLLERVLETEKSRAQKAVRKLQPESNRLFEDVIGASDQIRDLGRLVAKVAPLDVSVLIVGESGTGKELVARNIHRLSKRAAGPFVALNCSAIPETLIESELFGHARGAFTGAVAAKPGSVERAQKGTLFLDEIGDLSAAAQAKLLRVIQEREVQRLGETSVRKIDVRFLFATHKNLSKLVSEGTYREDLYYRISGYELRVSPLRERREDIPVLLKHFLEKYSRDFEKKNVHLSRAAMKVLCDHSWPGNVREMENLVQTLLVNADSDGMIDVDSLPSSMKTTRITENVRGLSLDEGRELFDRDFVLQALLRNQWNKSRAAKELKITRQGLINMIQRLRLEKK